MAKILNKNMMTNEENDEEMTVELTWMTVLT